MVVAGCVVAAEVPVMALNMKERSAQRRRGSAIMWFLIVGSAVFGGANLASAQELSLQEVLKEVPERHETWEITEAQIRQSQAARREVLALLLPQLSVSASMTRQGGDEVSFGETSVRPRYDWGINGTASMVLFDGPRYFDYQQAGALLEATKASARWQRHMLLLEAELSFFTLGAAQREVEIAEAAVEWRRQYLEQAEALVRSGMAISVDVSRARIQVLEAEQQLFEAEAALGNAADGLAALLGREPDGKLRAAIDVDKVAPGSPEEEGGVNEDRDDFAGRRFQVKAAELRRRGVWWGLLPRIGANINSQYGPETLFNPTGFNWSAGLSATWNLYDGGARYARADAAEAQIRQLELELERDQRLASVEVEQALRQWRSLSSAIDVAEEKVLVARETFEMVLARFEAGLATSLEVSDASQELLRAELGLNQVELQARLAEVRFRYLRVNDAEGGVR